MSELPAGWIDTTIETVAHNFDGQRVPVKASDRERRKGQYPYYGASGIIDHVDDYLFDGHFLLVAEDGANLLARSTPIAFQATGKFWVNNHAHVVTANSATSNAYLEHYLNSSDLAPYVTGSAQPKLTQKALNSLRVPLAPLPEQRRIVVSIDSLRARSARARHELDRIPNLVERYKQAILAKAFSGELTSDWRKRYSHDASQFLDDAGIAATEVEVSEPLPDGWYWAHAGAICTVKSGVTLGKKRQPGAHLVELPYLRVANVQRGWLDLSEIKTTRVTPREADALYLQPGDVLMNEGGDRDKLGRGWVWEGRVANCIHQNHVFRLRPKNLGISSRYISYYANEFGQRYFVDEGKQTTNLASISMAKVAALPIPICTPEEMTLIVERIEAAFSWLDKIATEHARAKHLLPKLDRAILAKAFRGELVPQDPNDEPAAVLLERIAMAREGEDRPRRSRRARR